MLDVETIAVRESMQLKASVVPFVTCTPKFARSGKEKKKSRGRETDSEKNKDDLWGLVNPRRGM